MKKSVVRMSVLFAVSLLFLSSQAHALTVGTPVGTLELDKFSVSGSMAYSSFELENTDVTSKSFIFKGTFGVSDKFTPYLKIGFSDIELEGGFEGNLGFAKGGGISMDIISSPEDSGFTAVLDAQAMWSDSSGSGTSHDLFQGQVALLGIVDSGGTKSYAGFASSFVTVDGGGIDISENGNTHIFFGVDYFMDYNFFLNLEAHVFNENTISVGVGYIF